jgi:hypothetical protein
VQVNRSCHQVSVRKNRQSEFGKSAVGRPGTLSMPDAYQPYPQLAPAACTVAALPCSEMGLNASSRPAKRFRRVSETVHFNRKVSKLRGQTQDALER